MSFSWIDRRTSFQALQGSFCEVLILGGGAVGCSLAATLAQMGIRVVLVERDDIASGASGHSTGLAHAGLRYLAQGRLLYVYHESRERQRLEELAPHWVRPFNFLLPVYREDPYRFWQVRIGTWIYDFFGWVDAALTRRKFPRWHRTRSVEDLRERLPGLQMDGLMGGVEYFVDAQLQDARFTLGWAQRAAECGASVLTYAEISGIDSAIDGVQTVSCVDRFTGERVFFKTFLVVNATGAWIDEVRQQVGLKNNVTLPSKGIHFIVDRVADTPLIFNTEHKGRVFFIIPAGRDASLVGTTDTPVKGPTDGVIPEASEYDELIRRLFRFFPYFKQGAHLKDAIELFKQVHIRDVFWGIRPLVDHGKESSKASREHKLIKETPTFWSIPGVKLTAVRAVALQTAKAAWKYIRKEPCPTLRPYRLPGGEIDHYDQYVEQARQRFKLGDQSDDIIAYLVSMYGTRYVNILLLADQEPGFRDRLLPEEPWILAEVAYAVEEEMILTLNDFLWRRTKWAHLRELPAPVLIRIAETMAERLNWSEEEVKHQLVAYEEERLRHRVTV